MKSRKLTSAVALLLFAVVPTALASTTWYVNGVSGKDSNNCLSASTPCKTIGHAIKRAASGDSINVAPAIYLENLTISKSLNVIGSSAKVTIIDGGNKGSVVTIPNLGTRVTLSKLTIRNGTYPNGAGINNSGILTISSSMVTANTAIGFCGAGPSKIHCHGGGIYNDGSLTINNSTISGNLAGNRTPPTSPNYGEGGGIYSIFGVLTIKSSTISSNTADGGGGIRTTLGTMTINNSTINSNKSGIDGGGAGIDNEAAATINNSTITGNQGRGVGSGINNGGTLIVNSSTVANNTASLGGGGIRNWYGTTTVQNSIVSNNSVGQDCNGPIASKGYNLSSDGSCSFKGPGDMNNINPVLGKLGNYGGPTQTIPLLSGSPAIDAGNPSGCTDGNGHLLKTDQRGMPRPDTEDKTGCDMGAYERQGD
jgi:hypothetical protein